MTAPQQTYAATETVPQQALKAPVQPQADPRKRAPSLFEKMTSRFGTQAKNAGQPAQPARTEPKVESQQGYQPSFNLDPTERLTPTRQEEETLDIPAFLRRQAN